MASSVLSSDSTMDWNRVSSRVLTGHSKSVNNMDVSGDGKFIASCGGHSVMIWETESGTQLQRIKIPDETFQAVAISSDGTRVIGGGLNKKVYAWDAQSRDELFTMIGHKYWIHSVAFSKDGTRIASACGKSVRLWDAKTGQLLLVFEDNSSRFYVPIFSEVVAVRSVIFSPDGMHVASGGADNTVKVWRVSDAYCIAVLKGHTDWITSLAISPDGQRIISGSHDDTARVWDWMAGSCVRVFTRGSGSVYGMGVSLDGALVASASKNDIVVWEMDTGVILCTLEGHRGDLTSIRFLSDGLVSSAQDRSVRIWKPSMNKVDSSSIQTSQPTNDPETTPLPDAEPQLLSTPTEPSLASPVHSRTTVLRSSSLPTPDPLVKRRVPPPPSTSSLPTSQSSNSRSPPPLPPRVTRESNDLPQRSSTVPVNVGPIYDSSEQLDNSPGSSLSLPTISTLVEPQQQLTSQDGWLHYIPSNRKFTGKYRKTTSEAIAYGGFSDVWPCEVVMRDRSVQKVALKELRAVNIPVTMSDSESILRRMLVRLEREIFVWTTLEHPHIVPLIGFRFQPSMCLISPWYSNGNVKDWIVNHPSDRRSLMLQVANGLQYLHSLAPPIIHGDIKSDNILISDEGNAVINDFGLSLVMEAVSGPNTNSTTGIGNARWLAPEIFCEEGMQRSWASDVYAFGCLILEIMTGAFPFRELSDMKVTLALASGKPPVSDKAIYPELPEDDILWDLMFDCWNPEPEERPTMKVIETRLQG